MYLWKHVAHVLLQSRLHHEDKLGAGQFGTVSHLTANMCILKEDCKIKTIYFQFDSAHEKQMRAAARSEALVSSLRMVSKGLFGPLVVY